MNKKLRKYLFITVSIAILLILSIPLFSDEILSVAATVNGKGIYYHELKEYAKSYVDVGRIKDNKEGMSTILETMIDEELILQIAAENDINITDKQVDRMIDTLIEKFQVDFASDLLVYVDSPSEFVLKRRLKIDMALLYMISKIDRDEELLFYVRKPDSKDISDYYHENYDEKYSARKEVRVSHILLTYPDDEYGKAEEANDLMGEILAQLNSGQYTFKELAKKYSNDIKTNRNGGDLGYFDENELEKFYKTYKDLAFNMDIGEVSEIIKLENAVAIITVTDIKQLKAKSISEVKNSIYEKLLSDNFYEKFGPYFNQFKKDSIIKINHF